MTLALPRAFEPHLGLMCCPRCGGDLAEAQGGLRCSPCDRVFPVEDEIPLLFWPNEWAPGREDVTESVRAFYEETPFPNYDDFDTTESLASKAREGVFARMLDEQVPPGARVLGVRLRHRAALELPLDRRTAACSPRTCA